MRFYDPACPCSVSSRPGCPECCRKFAERVDELERLVARYKELIIRLHAEGVLSEGQVSTATGLPRVEIRKAADELPLSTGEKVNG